MNIRDYLHFNRIKLKKYAEMIGVSQTYASNIVNGKAKPALSIRILTEILTNQQVNRDCDWEDEIC